MIGTLIDEIKDFAVTRAQNPSPVWGLPWAFDDLNDLTGGIHRGQFLVVAARTSEGKSVFCNQVAMFVARDLLTTNRPGTVLIYSPEMHARELLLRYIQMRTGIPSDRIKRGNLSPQEFQSWLAAIEGMRQYEGRVVIQAEQSVDVQDLVDDIESRLIKSPENPPVLVIVDYVQYVGSQVGGNDYEKLTNVAKTLKLFANRTGIPILAAAQAHLWQPPKFGKEQKEEPPTMMDIEGSRMIPKLADVVIMLWRPAGKWGGRKAQVDLAKQRDGRTGTFYLGYDPETTRFASWGS